MRKSKSKNTITQKSLKSHEWNVDKSETACHSEKKAQKSGDFPHDN